MSKAAIRSTNIVLEVERKFCGLTKPCLTADAGFPNFRSLHNCGQQIIKDTYFDLEGWLSSHGMWIRQRSTQEHIVRWEAKCYQGGTYNNSMFEEVSDEAAIACCVQDVTGHAGTSDDCFGLRANAEMTTTRRSWLADDQFKIVMDSMDFGHEVGEVELERTITLPRFDLPSDIRTWKQEVAKEMDCEVEAFMKHYRWAFKPGVPRGKMSAYFERCR